MIEVKSLFLPSVINTPTCMLHSRKVDSVITQTSIRHELWVDNPSQLFMLEQITQVSRSEFSYISVLPSSNHDVAVVARAEVDRVLEP